MKSYFEKKLISNEIIFVILLNRGLVNIDEVCIKIFFNALVGNNKKYYKNKMLLETLTAFFKGMLTHPRPRKQKRNMVSII